MPTSRGRFRAAVSVGWIVLASAAFVYARIKNVPAVAAMLLAAAFLAEFPFYISPAFSEARIRNPILLALSCVIPWLLYSAPLGLVTVPSAAALAGIALVVSFWYRALPPNSFTDAGFMLFLATVILSRVFKQVYVSPVPKLDVNALGHVMLIRAGATAVLSFRGFPRETPQEYRFLPTAREWRTGLQWFFLSLPVIACALYALGLWKLRVNPNLAAAVPQFFGILWVVSLSEEFFFRGLLQQWLARWTTSSAAGLILASTLFGSVHLGVHYFPNWRYAVVAGLLGLASGIAFRQTKTIQSGMVTHALAATVYRVFFE